MKDSINTLIHQETIVLVYKHCFNSYVLIEIKIFFSNVLLFNFDQEKKLDQV